MGSPGESSPHPDSPPEALPSEAPPLTPPFEAPPLSAPSLEQNTPAPLGAGVAAALPLPAVSRRSHTVASATLLLMASSVLSGLLALVRIKYINVLFGAGVEQDAYRAAFKLPDLLNYFLIGGAASISLITILNRYRETGDEEGADRALSVVLTTMLCVLGAGVVLAELFAPEYVVWANKGFRTDPARAALCTVLTRIMLPAQIFFFIGSMLSARLQVRKIFLYQAMQPLIYNGGILLGAYLLHSHLQHPVYSLAIGVLAGTLCGPAMLNALGAFRTGLRYRPIVGFRDSDFREWFRLSVPLMIGVSLVMFDGLFLNYFASQRVGGITLISNAKDLFNAPFNVIGPAAGAASLPFFASLFQQGRAFDFSASVSRSVSRLAAVGLLVSAWMIALAPWLMDLFRGGKFNRADAAGTTHLFVLLSLTLPLWAVQGIYARAFYAAGDTRTPAITGTLITVLSAPMYWALYNALGLRGLALSSDIGIAVQTISLAVLLQRKRLVSLAHLEWPELARALIAAMAAGGVTAAVVQLLPAVRSHSGDALVLAAGTAVWLAVLVLILVATKSKLPAQVLRRRK